VCIVELLSSMSSTSEISMFNQYNNTEGKNATRTGNWAEEAVLEEAVGSAPRIKKDDGKSNDRTMGGSNDPTEFTTTYRLAHTNPNSVKECLLPYDTIGARSKRELSALKAIVDKEFSDAEAKASATSREMAPMSQSHENYQAAPLEKYLEARSARIKGQRREYQEPLPPVEGSYTEGTTVTIWEQSLSDPNVEFTKSFIYNQTLPFGYVRSLSSSLLLYSPS
jgi:hypothetical protein